MRESSAKQEWKALIDAVIEFRKVSCWDWMYDSDIFAIQNPESGEIGYCSVLGFDSNVSGLIVFLGKAGFSTLMQMYALDQVDRDSLDFLFLSKYLSVTFEDRDELDARDLEILRDHRFEGEKSWPRFRRRDPGYCPWYFSVGDARFLKAAVEQAMVISTRLIQNEISLHHPRDAGYILLRRAVRRGNRTSWQDSWHIPAPRLEPGSRRIGVDAKKIQAVLSATRTEGDWELDTFFAPLPTRGEDGRPYYPVLLMCVEKGTGRRVGTRAIHPGRCEFEITDYLLDLMIEAEAVPRNLFVRKEQLYGILRELASRVGFNLSRVPALSMDRLDHPLPHDTFNLPH